MLLDAPHACECLLQRSVHARACMREAQRLRFDAVHEDDADAGKRVVA
jgi:hypothetical protein